MAYENKPDYSDILADYDTAPQAGIVASKPKKINASVEKKPVVSEQYADILSDYDTDDRKYQPKNSQNVPRETNSPASESSSASDILQSKGYYNPKGSAGTYDKDGRYQPQSMDEIYANMRKTPDAKTAAETYGIERGIGNIARGVKRIFGSDETQADLAKQRQEFDAVAQEHPSAKTAETVGEVLPALPFGGVGAAVAKTLLPRMAISGAIGATDMGLASAGRSDTGADIGINALVGTAAGVGGEAAAHFIPKLIPVVKNKATQLWEKVFGKKAPDNIIDAAGNPSPEMQAVLDKEGKTLDDLAAGVTDQELQAAAKAEAMGAPNVAQEAAQQAPKTEKELAQDVAKKRFDELAGEVDVDPSIRGAARRLDIDVNPSVYSRNQTYREIEQGLASIPGSELNKINVEAVQKLATKADDLITEFGGTLDKSEFSANFARRSENTVTDLSKQSNKLYDTLNKEIPKSTKVEAPNLLSFLEQRAEEFGGIKDMPALEKQYLKRLRQGPITYTYMDQLRKDLGRAAYGKGDDIFKNADAAILKQLERTLLEDQRVVASQFGQGETFDVARGLVSQRKQIEGKLKEAFGKKLQRDVVPTLSKALKDLSVKGSDKSFKTVINAVPEDMRQEAILTALNDVFTGVKNKQDISIAGFSNWFNGLKRNKEAYQLFKSYIPEAATKRLNDIATLANGIARAQKSYIATGRAELIPKMFEDLSSGFAKIFKSAAQKGAGVAVDVATSTPGAFTFLSTLMKPLKKSPAKAADELLASKKFRDTVETYYTKGQSAAQKESDVLEKTAIYKKWFDMQDAATQQKITTQGFLKWFATNEPAKEE